MSIRQQLRVLSVSIRKCTHIVSAISVKCWNSEKIKRKKILSVDEEEQSRGNVVKDSWVYHCPELCKLVLHDSLSSLIKATSRWADFAHAKPSQPPSSPYSCRSTETGNLKSSLLTSFLFFLPASCSPLGLDLWDHSSIWKGCILKLSLQPSGDMRRTLENLIFLRSVSAVKNGRRFWKMQTLAMPGNKYWCSKKILHQLHTKHMSAIAILSCCTQWNKDLHIYMYCIYMLPLWDLWE